MCTCNAKSQKKSAKGSNLSFNELFAYMSEDCSLLTVVLLEADEDLARLGERRDRRVASWSASSSACWPPRLPRPGTSRLSSRQSDLLIPGNKMVKIIQSNIKASPPPSTWWWYRNLFLFTPHVVLVSIRIFNHSELWLVKAFVHGQYRYPKYIFLLIGIRKIITVYSIIPDTVLVIWSAMRERVPHLLKILLI